VAETIMKWPSGAMSVSISAAKIIEGIVKIWRAEINDSKSGVRPSFSVKTRRNEKPKENGWRESNRNIGGVMSA
jgi:hypothetical protein